MASKFKCLIGDHLSSDICVRSSFPSTTGCRYSVADKNKFELRTRFIRRFLWLKKVISMQHLENVQAIAHLLDPIQTINNGQSDHFDGKNNSLSTHFHNREHEEL